MNPKRPKAEPIRNPTLFQMEKLEKATPHLSESTALDSFRADSFVFQMFGARLSGTLLAVRRVLLVH